MMDFFPKKISSIEIKNEIDYIKKWEARISRKELTYRVSKYKYKFQQFETVILLVIVFILLKLIWLKLSNQSMRKYGRI